MKLLPTIANKSRLVAGLLVGAALAYHLPLRAALPMTESSSLAPMLERVTPAVINIATEGRVQIRQNPLFADPFFRRFFNVPDHPMERKTQSLGSGVIVDAERGLALTNHHVIANAEQVTVTLQDGRRLEAEIVGADPATDVAVIKLPAQDLRAIEPADSGELRVGDFVVAIGNPFGLGQTVTSGIVSALSRSGLGIEGYEDFIQTDASINPGNSGGALVNLKGELAGINTAIFSRGGGNIGIGFAIPTNLALQVMEQLLDTGRVTRGFVGLQVQDLNAELAEAFGIDRQQGAVVNRVLADSPAQQAGLRPGDVVVSVNARPIKSGADLRNRIGLLRVGEQVEFRILRDGEARAFEVRVAENKDPERGPVAVNPRLEGVTLGAIEKNHPYYGRLRGVVVANLARGARAWSAGLRRGDIITSVNNVETPDVKAFLERVNQLEESLLLRVVRGNTAAFLVLK